MSKQICPVCGNSYHDLGWLNNEYCKAKIEAIERRCKELGHKPSNGPKLDTAHIENNYKGFEHVVSCHECKYIYRYDSSD